MSKFMSSRKLKESLDRYQWKAKKNDIWSAQELSVNNRFIIWFGRWEHFNLSLARTNRIAICLFIISFISWIVVLFHRVFMPEFPIYLTYLLYTSSIYSFTPQKYLPSFLIFISPFSSYNSDSPNNFGSLALLQILHMQITNKFLHHICKFSESE